MVKKDTFQQLHVRRAIRMTQKLLDDAKEELAELHHLIENAEDYEEAWYWSESMMRVYQDQGAYLYSLMLLKREARRLKLGDENDPDDVG